MATLNLYSRTGPFDETAEIIAAVLAAQVAIAVSRSPEFAAARGVVEQPNATPMTTPTSTSRLVCSW